MDTSRFVDRIYLGVFRHRKSVARAGRCWPSCRGPLVLRCSREVSGDDLSMTEKGRALFGFKPEASIDFAAILDQVHPEDRAVRRAAIKQALRTQGEYEMEYRVQSAYGPDRWISARGRCLGGSHDRSQKLLGVSMDVTGRKQAEMETGRQRAELGHLSRVALVNEMPTSLAHELNQPLTAIVTNAKAAQRFIANGNLNPTELSKMLADISADGRRASEVIRASRAWFAEPKANATPST
jgi:PAS domain S-box-containing protein